MERATVGFGLSPLRVFLSLLSLVGLGCLIYFVVFADDSQENRVVKAPSEKKLQQTELTVDQRLEQILRFKPANDANFLGTIDEVLGFESELETMESKPGLTEQQKVKIEQIHVRNQSVVVTTMVSNKIDCEAEKAKLFRYCSQRIDAEDDQLKEACRFWLIAVPAIEFAEAPSEQTHHAFATALTTYPDGYLKTPENAATLCGIMVRMSKGGPVKKQFALKGFDLMTEQLAKSELESIHGIGNSLREFANFGDYDLPTLGERLRWSDPSAQKDLAGAFDALVKFPETETKTWVTLIRAYENLLSTDKIEETGAAWKRMWDMSSAVPTSEKKKLLQQILDRQRTRAMSIGTPFDISGTTAGDGKEIVDNKEFSAIFFCDKSRTSMNSLAKLGAAIKEQQIGYLPIVAFEKDLTKEDIETLHMVPESITIASHETAKKYFEAFPIDFFPYLLLVDKQGKILAANLAIEQIPTRIAAVKSAQRRAARDAASPAASQ